MAQFPSRLPAPPGKPNHAENSDSAQPQIANTQSSAIKGTQFTPKIAAEVPVDTPPSFSAPGATKRQKKPLTPTVEEEDMLDNLLDAPLAEAPTPVATPQPEPQPDPTPQQAPQTETPSVENIRTVAEAEINQQEVQLQAIQNLPMPLKNSILKLMDLITDDVSTEVTLNGPGTVGVKQNGQRYIINDIDFGDVHTYHSVINSFILPYVNTSDRIGTTDHLIEGQLNIPDTTGAGMPPQIARVTIILPPTVPSANVTIAKKAKVSYTLDDLVAKGTMTSDMGELLKKFAKGRVTMVVSGATGAGKTTLTEAIYHEFDVSDRIVLVEDTKELDLAVNDLVALQSRPLRPGEPLSKEVTLEWLVKQANRIRPDRIIVGEIRGAEMLEFLTAANSGMDGSMTTIHADSPQKAIYKMVSLAGYANFNKSEFSVLRDIATSIHVIIQLDRINGRHVLTQIEEVTSTVSNAGTGIQTATIYRFDRNTERFNFETRISDELTAFLRQRGVDIQNAMPSSNAYGTRL